MKTLSIRIQFYLLVPIIFAGFTALASLLTYQLMRLSRVVVSGEVWPLLTTGGILVFTAFCCGLLILWQIFRPLETFLKKTEQLVPPEASVSNGVDRVPESHPVAPFTRTLNWVTEMLSHIEARALFPDIVAPSSGMRSILGLIMKIAPTDSTVLILGESGTGKELVAHNIHSHSPRADRPFVAINCAGIPEGLLESELFGHEKGSFTGAYAQKKGKLEVASGGTVFLDEIADMPMVIQAKILRVLQERELERVGGTRMIPIDIRVIAATNKDLLSMVKSGAFREDLFFRIDVFSFRLPPLRERSEDIPILASHLLRQIKPEASLSPRALATLTAQPWPGNIRELKNSIEAASALADSVIEPEHLNTGIRSTRGMLLQNEPLPSLEETTNIDDRIHALEKGIIIDALMRVGGVQVRAAELLGIKERSLWHRIAKHQIDVSAIRVECQKRGPSHHDVMGNPPKSVAQ